MDDNLMVECSSEEEKNILTILMDSDLYPELSLDERHLLLKRVIDCYRAIFPMNEQQCMPRNT